MLSERNPEHLRLGARSDQRHKVKIPSHNLTSRWLIAQESWTKFLQADGRQLWVLSEPHTLHCQDLLACLLEKRGSMGTTLLLCSFISQDAVTVNWMDGSPLKRANTVSNTEIHTVQTGKMGYWTYEEKERSAVTLAQAEKGLLIRISIIHLSSDPSSSHRIQTSLAKN